MKTIEEQLILHEGIRLKPYKCPAGYWTIGAGRNLEAKGLSDFEQVYVLGEDRLTKQEVIEKLKEQGITKDHALFLLQNDIVECEKDLQNFAWFKRLDQVRKKAIIDMRFNLGPTRFSQFRRMINHLKNSEYNLAAGEMVNSLWYQQVGSRSKRLVEMMRTGEDYTD